MVKFLIERGADVVDFMRDLDLVNSTAEVREAAEGVNSLCADVGLFTEAEMGLEDFYRAFSFIKLIVNRVVPPSIEDPAERSEFEKSFGKLVRFHTRIYAFSLTGSVRGRESIIAFAAPLYPHMSAQPLHRRAEYIAQLIALFSSPADLRDLWSLRCVCRCTREGRFPLLQWQKELDNGIVESFLGSEACRYADMPLLNRVLRYHAI